MCPPILSVFATPARFCTCGISDGGKEPNIPVTVMHVLVCFCTHPSSNLFPDLQEEVISKSEDLIESNHRQAVSDWLERIPAHWQQARGGRQEREETPSSTVRPPESYLKPLVITDGSALVPSLTPFGNPRLCAWRNKCRPRVVLYRSSIHVTFYL